jgi:hypothetical protein
MKPPWWSNLWFAYHSFGLELSLVLIVAALAALVLRRDALTWWAASALAVPLVFHCFIAHVTLGYYWVMWTPMLFVLAALGIRELAVRARAVPAAGSTAAVAAAAVLLAVPVGESVDQSVQVARLKPMGMKELPALMKQDGLHGPVLEGDLPAWGLDYYLPGTAFLSTATGSLAGVETVVTAQPSCGAQIDPSIRALVAQGEASGTVHEIYSDQDVTVYQVSGTLSAPTAAQIAAAAHQRHGVC